MKRLLLLSSLFMVFTLAFPKEKSSIINEVFEQYATQKVEHIQSLVKFTDEQAKQLKNVEYQFLLDVQKAENCWLCNKKKRVEKLKVAKYKAIEKILSKNAYIKYKAIDNNEIKKMPLWAD
ncbi:MAG TPA: hypothetical protein GXZ87_00560 [Bacteroidales bacterium]|nr:hypothetical protein [Bacteroidales bacterium]